MQERSCAILIRTYYKDADRLEYCLSSIDRFCSGFDEVVVVCKSDSIQAIEPVVARHPIAVLKLCPECDDDYMGQQITKLRAHTYVKSNYIFHVDSDCIFTDPFDPSMYFSNDLPILFHREYEFFYENNIHMPWQKITSEYADTHVDLEFMSLFPLVYPRTLYADLESWFVSRHHYSYEDIPKHINSSRDFSEFNLLGAFSYYRHREGRPYHHHLNWGEIPPKHYLIQACQEGQIEDRSIGEAEQRAFDAILQRKDD